MLIINLAGEPGAGESTGAIYICSMLKMAGINTKDVSELTTEKTCEEKVTVVVTDCPLFLSAYYNTINVLDEPFNETVMNEFNSYENITYLIERVKEYNPKGRLQTQEKSTVIGQELRKFMENNGVLFDIVAGNQQGYDNIVSDVIKFHAIINRSQRIMADNTFGIQKH